MKKYIYLFFIVLHSSSLVADFCSSCHENTSHTFMFTRPITEHLGINQALWHNIAYCKHGCSHSAVQSTVIFQESTNDLPTGRYFLLPCKDNLLVSGDANVDDKRTRDIRAEWIGLPADFRGFFSVHPKQRQFCWTTEYNQDLGALCGDENPVFKNSWFSVELPLVFVENNMRPEQTDVVNPSPTPPTDLLQAFNQCSWQFAKIDGPCSVISVADLKIKLGRTYMAENNFLLAYYTVLLLPTGNKQNPKRTFSPVAGSNSHFGYGVGANFQILVSRDCAAIPMCLFVNLEGIFYAHNTQLRTFDLRFKPLSRYLLLVERDQTDTAIPNVLIPGVNVLTREVQVHPYGFADFSAGFRWIMHRMEFEFGYNIWGKGPEKVFLRCRFPEKWGIAGTFIPSIGTFGTASKSTIANQAPNDVKLVRCPEPCTEIPKFVPILESDLDEESATARSAFNHKVHLALGWHSVGECIDTIFGVGVFYELPMKNAALPLMGGWAKVGASF